MTIVLPEELKKKDEELREYVLPDGSWKPDTPERIKQYAEEVEQFYMDNM